MKELLLCVLIPLVVTGCRTKDTGGVNVYSVPQSTFENLRNDEIGAFPSPDKYSYYLSAIFFEANQDGVQRALVEGFGEKDRSGGSWEHYVFTGGRWHQTPIKLSDGSSFYIDSAHDFPIEDTGKWDDHLWAYPWDFYAFTEKGKPPKLLTIHIFGLSDRDDGNVYIRNVDNIAIAPEGYLKVIPMPDFKKKFSVEYDNGVAKIILKSPKDKLERIQVQTFNPQDSAQGK